MGALATAASPAFFSARGAWGASGPNNQLQIGCIGVGRQGRGDMLECIHQGLDRNVRVVAVCDVDSKRLALAKELVETTYKEKAEQAGAYGSCAVYDDYRELLARKDLDGVLITTPEHWHGLIGVAAAKAGKDIYVEKPVTYSLLEGRQLVRAVRGNDRVLQVGSQQRSSIYFRKACELVRNGRVGNLHTIRVGLPEDKGHAEAVETKPPENLDYEMWMGPTAEAPYSESRVHPQEGWGRPGWLQIERYCLGMITGWGSHMNDIAQWGNGSDKTGPIEMEATAEFPKRGIFDVHTTFKAEGKYANGVKLLQETGKAGVKFEGDEGWIFVTRGEFSASDPKLLKEKLPKNAEKLYVSDSHMGNFLDCMRTRKDPITRVEIGHRSNSVCLITHIAMKLGRKLRWDPKTERFKNDDEANRMLDYPHRAPWKIA